MPTAPYQDTIGLKKVKIKKRKKKKQKPKERIDWFKGLGSGSRSSGHFFK